MTENESEPNPPTSFARGHEAIRKSLGNAIEEHYGIRRAAAERIVEAAIDNQEVDGVAQAVLATSLTDMGRGDNEFAIWANQRTGGDAIFLGIIANCPSPMLAAIAHRRLITNAGLGDFHRHYTNILQRQSPQVKEGNFLGKLLRRPKK